MRRTSWKHEKNACTMCQEGVSHPSEVNSIGAHTRTLLSLLLLAMQKPQVNMPHLASRSRTCKCLRSVAAKAADNSQSMLVLDVEGKALSREFWTKALRRLGHDGEVIGATMVGTENDFSSLSGLVTVHVKGSTIEERPGDLCEYEHMFVKRTVVRNDTLKSWPDTKRGLVKGQTEVIFYHEFAQQLIEAGVQVPRLLNSEERFAILDELDGGEVPNNWADDVLAAVPGCVMVLQNIPAQSFSQNAPLAYAQARQALTAVAKLHAAAWERRELLSRAAQRLPQHGGVWHLSIRNPKEITKLEHNWERFLNVFEKEIKMALSEHTVDTIDIPAELRAVGARLVAVHQELSEHMSAEPDSPHATLVHGDYKAMNVFLANSTTGMAASIEDDRSVIIDFSHIGVGFGMSDVAFLLTHSVAPALLDNDLEGNEVYVAESDLEKALPLGRGELQLVRDYYDSLQRVGGERVKEYSWDLAVRQYIMGLLDYGRFVIARFWGDVGHDSFAMREANPNVLLQNRDVVSAVRFALHMERCLTWFEENRMVETKTGGST